MLVLLVLACHRPAPPAPAVAPGAAPPAPLTWTAPLGHDHPWTGRLWSTEENRWIEESELLEALRRADVVLLGEKHDHPDHHRLQARVLRAIVEPGMPVLFEQLDLDDPVDGATHAAALAEAVAWDRSGWPDFALYEPVFTAVYERGGRVLPAHPTRAQVQAAMSEGIGSLGPDRWPYAHVPLSEAQRAALEQEIVDAHCGMFDVERAAPLVEAQVLKDATMAGALTAAGFPAVLIAGGGHTRPDRGVPHHLDADTVTVLFREVHDDLVDVPVVGREADFVWFTARLDDTAPCERFREQLERMR